MKEFWKKSAALLMAMSLLMGNNYAIHASGEEGEEQPTGEEQTQEVTSSGIEEAQDEEKPSDDVGVENTTDHLAEGDQSSTNESEDINNGKTDNQGSPETDTPVDENKEENSDEAVSVNAADETVSAPSEYFFEDENGKVAASAIVTENNVLPEEAKLKVTEVTPYTAGYNYEAYIQALNDNSDTIVYTSENTLLFDVSFVVGDSEIEPMNGGTVAVTLDFKDGQIKDSLNAQSSDNIEIKHLPLKEEVKAAVNSTAEATDIKSDDILVEDFANTNVDADSEVITFETNSFSLIAITATDTNNFNDLVNVSFVNESDQPISADLSDYYLLATLKGLKGSWDGTNFSPIGFDLFDLAQLSGSVISNGRSYGINDEQGTVPDKKYVDFAKMEQYGQIRNSQDYSEATLEFDIVTNNGGGTVDENMIRSGSSAVQKLAIGDVLGSYELEGVEKTDGGKTIKFKFKELPHYSITVESYEMNKTTSYAPTAEDIPGQYYVRVKATDGQGNEVFAVKKISLTDAASHTVTLNGFFPVADAADYNGGETADRVAYNSSFVINQVRIISGSFSDYDELMSATDTIDGFVYFYNEQSPAGSNSHLVKMRKAYDGQLNTIINMSSDELVVSESDNLYVFVEVQHESTGTTYSLQKVTINNDTSVTVPVTEWKNQNGEVLPNEKFTGHEKSVSVKLIQSTSDNLSIQQAISGEHCTVKNLGDSIKDFYVSEYVTTPDVVDDADTLKSNYNYKISLTKSEVTADYTLYSVLGPSFNYGITAGSIKTEGHSQTNLATKEFSGTDNFDSNLTGPDGKGENPGTVIVSRIVPTEQGVDSKVIIGSATKNPIAVFVGTGSVSKVVDDTHGDKMSVIPTDEETLDGMVDSMISHMQAVSADMAKHKPTVTPTFSEGNAYIDTTNLPDGATIYIDADDPDMLAAIQKDGGVNIKKLPNQLIVFNFLKPHDEVTLASVNVDDDGTGYKNPKTEWNPQSDGDRQKNMNADHVARQLVYNCVGVKTLAMQSAGGVYLMPNAGDEYVTHGGGTSCGWIVAAGRVLMGSGGEFHSVNGELNAINEVNLRAQKNVDGMLATDEQLFKFKVSKYNNITKEFEDVIVKDETEQDIPLIVENDGGFITVALNDFSEGINIAKLSEVNEAGDGYIHNDQSFYGKFNVDVLKDEESGAITAFPGPVTYYKTFDPATGELTDPVAVGVFNNETHKLKVTKSVISSDDNDKAQFFSFTVTLGATDLNGKYGDMTFTNGVATFKLRDGQSKTATGLPANVSYSVTETNVDGFSVKSTGATGVLDNNEKVAVFTNTKDDGTIGALKITKQVTVNGSATTGTLADGTYSFSIKKDGVEKATTSITITNGVAASAVVNNLEPGEYTVEETETHGLTPTYDNQTVTVAGGETADTAQVVTVTNNKEVGSLEITKNVTVNGEATTGTEADGTYTFNVKKKDSSGAGQDVTITITNGVSNTATVNDLEAGTYVVTETVPAGMTVDENSKEVTVNAGATATAATVSFTNNKTVTVTGALKITKQVTVNGSATTGTLADGTYSFSIKKDGVEKATTSITITNGVAASAVVNNLEPGEYTVEETETHGLTPTYDNQTVTVAGGETADTAQVVTVTNNKEVGSLEITKNVTVNGRAGNLPDEATVTFKIEDQATEGKVDTVEKTYPTDFSDGKVTISGLPVGHTFKITETATTPEGYTRVTKVKVGEGEEREEDVAISEAITADGTSKVSFTNAYAEEDSGFILKVDRPLSKENPVREEGVQFQVYDAQFKKGEPYPDDKRMLFIKVEQDKEGTNVYRYVNKTGTPNSIATDSKEGDTLETGKNGFVKILGIVSGRDYTAVETKNLPGYASFETNHPTPLVHGLTDTLASDMYKTYVALEKIFPGAFYFVDAPVTTDLHVTKKYTDGNTNHPKDEIEVTLYKIVGDKEEALTTAKLNAGNEWKASFKDLPMRDNVGNLVKYQVRETKGGEGYTVSYSPSNISQLDGDHDYKEITVTNTKEEEKPKESEKPKPSEGPKYEEQKRNVPNTSDNFNAFFWMSSLLVSVVAGCWAAITLHRYN